ncbi:four-carbon acid sugar kinase family protein (plasmid) [Sinorhizobium sp. K101]|nr:MULTISPECIES: four-carbon acid sugar kinase family protein [unclassified Sinorhizobium]WEJ08737.1 four-carbon acid sugar kinase family protein [Sinorhizobium sp. M103]WEJ13762.1 four-carbon acid sugar kinase family protein [Sinorhizobium sp. K101]
MEGKRPLVGFYGDDFTGSSENLAQFHRNGLRTRLYLRVPSQEALAEAACDLDVVGFAGTARALDNSQITAEVFPAFKALQSLGCTFLQYKICSTFDSAPQVGNFGFAAEQLAGEEANTTWLSWLQRPTSAVTRRLATTMRSSAPRSCDWIGIRACRTIRVLP